MSHSKYLVSTVTLAVVGLSFTLPVVAETNLIDKKKDCPVSQALLAEKQAQDIVDTAVSAGSFKILATALQAADLVEILKGEGPFTVFAPTDAAFAALPPATLEKLLKPENKAVLVQILTYHVVPGKVMSGDLKNGVVKTVEGSPVTVKIDEQTVMVNNATVTTADIATSNGVIHVINQVILPPDLNL